MPSPPLPAPWDIALTAAALAALAAALLRLPYRILWTSQGAQHLFFAACVGLGFLWLVRAGITPGLAVHFLGVTAVTLLVGWPLAVVATLAASVAVAVVLQQSWLMVVFEFTLSGVLPVLVSHGVRLTLERLFPPHLFIYLLGGAFAGGILAGLVSRGAVALVLLLSGTYGAERIGDEMAVIVGLTALPEGVINGMIISVLAVYRPKWLKGFDDSRYLGER